MPELVFLPWLRVEDQETFGPIGFVPRDAALEQLGGHDRAYADAMCAAYREHHAEKNGEFPAAPITFIRYKTEPLTASLPDGAFAEIGRCLRVLGAIAHPARQGDYVPSNAFVPFAQLYKEESFSVALASGKVLSGGLDMRRLCFHRPAVIPTGARLVIRLQSLREATEKLIQVAEPTEDHLRVTRSLEWYFAAHLDLDEQNAYVPFVLGVTAFESLLDLERSSGLGFAKTLADRLQTPDDQVTTRKVGDKDVSMNEQGWWALEFYRLRSEAVHGQAIDPSGHLYNGQSHLKLGERAFPIALQQELNGLGLLELPLGPLGRASFLEALRTPPQDE